MNTLPEQTSIHLLNSHAFAKNTQKQPKQLLIDVTNIIQYDHGTGIQRVVKALYTQLIELKVNGYVIKPVYTTKKRRFRYAPEDFLKYTDNSYLKSKNYIKVQSGDVFLGLDLNANRLPLYQAQLALWKLSGVSINIVIYDTLPLSNPEWFQEVTGKNFKQWMNSVVLLSNAVICISNTVKDDFLAWAKHNYKSETINKIKTYVIPMGMDIHNTAPSYGLPADFDTLALKLKQKKFALIVGTIEPRKGHEQILDAFEVLWQAGHSEQLVIVGRPGWKTEALQERLLSHPQRSHQLFWFENASDEMLNELYSLCDGVIVASFAEGFGLPLLEAAHYNKPIFARNLPVFKENAMPNITYFSETESKVLANSILNWLNKPTTNENMLKTIKLHTWKEATQVLIKDILSKD